MTTTYLFDKANRTNTMSMQRQAISIIQAFFTQYQSLVGKPIFTVNSDKVIVQLFYYTSFGADNISNDSVIALGDALTRC
jgi:hypothetical protein